MITCGGAPQFYKAENSGEKMMRYSIVLMVLVSLTKLACAQISFPALSDGDANKSTGSWYEQRNDIPAPAGRWGAGAVSDPQLVQGNVIKYPATQAEALRCNAVLDLGHIAKMNNSSDKRLAIVISPDKTDRVPLWNLIVSTSPELSRMAADAAYNKMYVIRDKYTADNMNKYLGNIDLLVRDYQNCQAKGMIRS